MNMWNNTHKNYMQRNEQKQTNEPKFYIIKYSKNMFAYIKQLNVFNCNHN